MKQIITIITLLSFLNLFSQAADIDKEYFPVSYVNLPSNPLLNENERTYKVVVNAPDRVNDAVSTVAIGNDIQIRGFIREEGQPSVIAELSFSNLTYDPESFQVVKTRHEEKDEAGNIVKVYYTFTYSFVYDMGGGYNIQNPLNIELNDQYSDHNTYRSNEFNSEESAYLHFKSNKEEIKDMLMHGFIERVSQRVNKIVNVNFGYRPTKTNVYLWILDSERNPLTAAHKQAFSAVEKSMAHQRFDSDITELRKNIMPIAEQFAGMAETVPGDSRKKRKVRFACIYNAAVLSYYMDRPQEALKYAKKLGELNYHKEEVASLMAKISDLQGTLAVNMLDSRRIPIRVDERFNTIESEERSDFAFVVTALNDTLIANINYDALQDIGKELRVFLPDEKGNLKLEVFDASEVKEVVFDEDNVFVRKEFISYKDNPRARVARSYLVRKEFESDLISMYIFKDEEVVLFMGKEQTGYSSRSYKFIMGFKKQLKQFSENICPSISGFIDEDYYKNNPASLRTFVEDAFYCE